MMGDDGEKFGGVADDLGALLGRGPLGRALLRGARGERRLADDDDPVGLARRPPADRPGLHPDRVLRRDGRVGAAARREPGVLEVLHDAQERATPRGALAARRVLAQLPGQVPRDQRPPQADAAGLGRGRGDARRPGPRAGARPPLPGPVERLLLARAVRRDLHQPHAARHVRAPHRRRGPRRDGDGTLVATESPRPRHGRRRRGPAGRRRAGRDGRPRRWRRHRRLGHPGGPPRARSRHAPAAGGVSRGRCASSRRPGARRRRGRRPATAAPASIHDVVRVKEQGWRRIWSTTPTSGDPGSSAALGHEVTAEDWAKARGDRARRRRRRRVRARRARRPAGSSRDATATDRRRPTVAA